MILVNVLRLETFATLHPLTATQRLRSLFLLSVPSELVAMHTQHQIYLAANTTRHNFQFSPAASLVHEERCQTTLVIAIQAQNAIRPLMDV